MFDQLGAMLWYLRLLRDEGKVVLYLVYVLGISCYVAWMFGRVFEVLQLLVYDDDLRLCNFGEICAAMGESAAW